MNLHESFEIAKRIVEDKRKGSFFRAYWKTRQDPSKEYKNQVVLQRMTTAVVRLGIDYSNLGIVKKGIENKERGPVGPLNPLGSEWLFFPFVLKTTKGTDCFRIYQNPTNKLSTTFLVDGCEVTEEEYCRYLTPSEVKAVKDRDNRVCFSVNIENLEITFHRDEE